MGLVIGALAGAVAALVVCGGLAWRGCTYFLPTPERDLLFEADCGSAGLRVERVYDLNRLAGVVGGEHLEATFGDVPLAMDGRAFPSVFTWDRPAYRERGDGAQALHVFVGGAPVDGDAVERCVEANAEALLAAIDAGYRRRPGDADFAGRRRVYWSAAPEALEPEFRDDRHTLRLLRDGRLMISTEHAGGGASETIDGRVVDGRIECCNFAADGIVDALVDADGQTLRQRLDGAGEGSRL